MYNWLSLSYQSASPKPTGRLIDPPGAIDIARRVIEEYNLTTLNPRINPENVLTPYKVKRLDRIDGGYFLVPVGEGNKISALINISVTGEVDGVTVWLIDSQREGGGTKDGQAAGTTRSQIANAGSIDHYIAPFELHPRFTALTGGEKSSLVGRTILLPGSDRPLTITSVVQDGTTPYVWRPCPESFSPSRPLLNLLITVEGLASPIQYSVPVDNYCLPTDDGGNILLPSPNYLEMVADYVKQKAGGMVDGVLALVNRRGTTIMVMYKSNQTIMPIGDEIKDHIRPIVCEYLTNNSWPGLVDFRIKAFADNEFLTRNRGGGGPPLGCCPEYGGGGTDPDFTIGSCL
jgi:hypothetical protein